MKSADEQRKAASVEALGLEFDPDAAYGGGAGPTTSAGLGFGASVPADLPAEHVDHFLEHGERPKPKKPPRAKKAKR